MFKFMSEWTERVKDLEVLLKELSDVVFLEGRKVYGRLNKLENTLGTLGLKERRITTLEQQVNDLINENVDIISYVRKLKAKDKALARIRDEERGGTVLKENELEPRVGDLVVSKKDERDIRKVCANGYGFLLVGRDFRTVYTKDSLVKDLMSEWKVIARREDLK